MKNAINLTVFLAVCIVLAFSGSASAGPCGTMGDINKDGKVGLPEAIYALQIAAGIQVEHKIEGDEAEPNDDQNKADPIFEDAVIKGNIGSGDNEEDWYKITMPANGLFQYSVENLNPAGTEQGIIGITKLYQQVGLDLIELSAICISRSVLHCTR